MKKKIKEEKNNKTKYIEIIDIIIFGIVFIMFGIALLSFFPGLVTSDNVDQINQAMLNMYNPAHPIIHSFIIGNLTKLGGIWVPALVQIIIFSTIWTYACKTVRKYNSSLINKVLQIIFTFLIAIIPLNFLYSITLWKDILYSYSILLLLVLIYTGIKEKFDYTNIQIVLISLSSVAIMMLRKNGLPIGVVMFAILLVLNVIKTKNIKNILKFICSFAIFLVLMNIPQWTVKRGEVTEGGSVLNSTKVYCIGALLNNGLELEEEEKEFLNTIIDLEEWKEKYNPFDGTPILFSKKLDNTVLASPENEKRFNEIFMKYAKQNKKLVLKHFMNVNSIWWSVKEIGPMHGVIINNGSVSEMSNGQYDNKPIYMKGNDKLSNYTIKTLMGSRLVYNTMYRPAVALYVSIILVIGVIAKQRKTGEKGYILLLFPMLMNIATYVILISSQDQRYFYPSFMTEYFIILVAMGTFIKNKGKNKKGEEVKTNLDNPKVIVIIPAYNEALNIEKTVKDVENNTDYDYVIINDCSKDDTKEVCEKNKFNMISLPVNYGLTSGIQLGMKYAKDNNYDIAIQFDGDGQHQAKYLKDLVDEMEKNDCDIVIGSRYVTEKKPHSMRMLGSRIISICIKLTTGKTVKDPTSGMRAFNKEMINNFVHDSTLTPEPDTIAYMIKKGKNVKEVQVEMKEREFGTSYLNPIKSIEYMANMVASILLFRNFQK